MGTNEAAQRNATKFSCSQSQAKMVHVRGVQFRLKSSRHPLYIMREATLLSHSARSCCSIGESNFVALSSSVLPLARKRTSGC